MQDIKYRIKLVLPVIFCCAVYSNKMFAQFSERITDTNYYQISNRFYSTVDTLAASSDRDGFITRFKRRELFWSNRLFPTGSFKVAANAINDYYSTNPIVPASISSNWTPIGPFTQAGGGGFGQILRIAFHPDFNGTNSGQNTNTIYGGATNGGVWKSTDGGVSWNVTGTDNQLPVLGITAKC